MKALSTCARGAVGDNFPHKNIKQIPILRSCCRYFNSDLKHIYEEIADDHTAVDYRMDVSLPVLAKALPGRSFHQCGFMPDSKFADCGC